MKNLLLLAVIFFSGCIGSDYQHRIYKNGKLVQVWKVSRKMANVNQNLGFAVIRFSDGTVIVLKSDVIKDSPNSGYAEAAIVGAVMSGGASEIIKGK